MRVQLAPPPVAVIWPILRGPYSGLAQIHPALRRILLELGVVGDRPAERGLRPELRRDLHVVAIVFRVGRRVVLELVGDIQHQAAVGMVDRVGAELAGRGFGLDARDQLPARRADHLDLHERKTLVERLDGLAAPARKSLPCSRRACLPFFAASISAWPPTSSAAAGRAPSAAAAMPRRARRRRIGRRSIVRAINARPSRSERYCR